MEAERFKEANEAIQESSKQKGFGVIAVLLNVIYRALAIKAE
jgi:uncharacterized protein (DUF302 family)